MGTYRQCFIRLKPASFNFDISYQVEDEKDEKLLLSLKFQEPIKICIDGIFYNNELELHIINGGRYRVIISD